MESKPKIYCFIDARQRGGGDVKVRAIDAEGETLAIHVSSSEGWARHDIGYTSDWKHEAYRERHPEGFELVWVDSPKELPASCFPDGKKPAHLCV